MLPGMDGWDVLGQLKASPETADIPVMMLTMLDDRRTGYTLGAADYLMKPLERERVVSVLGKHAHLGRVGRVLLVDDDSDNRLMMRRILEREGWLISEAENGRVALECLPQCQPDIILLDLMMPEMDGLTFLSELRLLDAWRSIPVIILSARELSGAERQQLHGCVARVLQKGACSQEYILAELRRVLLARIGQSTRPVSTSDQPGMLES
jgi:CheY-like chemotaxis protein